MEVHPGRLTSTPAGFEQLKSRPDLTFNPAGRPIGTNVSSAVQQQDYLASVWLSKKERLENSQQKCIVIFALVCCFAVLVALIFSAVDVLGEDEDGITEENCNKTCQVVLVENIPEDISISHEGTMPLTDGFNMLLDQAQRSVEIVSPWWDLNSTEPESRFPQAKKGQLLLHRLMGLKANGVQLKIASGIPQSPELTLLSHYGAEVHDLNMTALTRGHLLSSFWVVDRKHLYIGSASMDWRSLSKLKELGVIIYNCSCLVLDLHRIFSLYWQLQYRDFVPAIWSKRLTALYNDEKTLSFSMNGTNADAYFSSSPNLFCPKNRTRDIDAIAQVILDAKQFIYISVTDYLPLIRLKNKYWSRIDGVLREALILKRIKLRLLISCREQTHPLTFNFLWSLQNLCTNTANCSVEARFFSPQLLDDGSPLGINHHRYMVTDNSVYIGNLDWVGDEFLYNAGAALVVNQLKGVMERNSTLVAQLRRVFDRDWRSSYAKYLQPNKIPTCSTNSVFPSDTLKGRTGHVEQEESPNASL